MSTGAYPNWWCQTHDKAAAYYMGGEIKCLDAKIVNGIPNCVVVDRDSSPLVIKTSTPMRDFMSDLNTLVKKHDFQKESVAHLLMLKAEALELEIQQEALDEELRKVVEGATGV